MVSVDTLDMKDTWSLDFIYNNAQKMLEEGKLYEAKKLCIHGQIESSKKEHKDWGKKFDELYIDIDMVSEILKKKEIEQTKNEDQENEESENETNLTIKGHTNLTSVKGIGVAAAKKLNENGIFSIEQLADYSPDKLSKFKGIGINSAKKIIENSKLYLKTKEKKHKFISIQDFAEKPPDILNSITKVESCDKVTTLLEIDNLPNFDRLNEPNQIEQENLEKIDDNKLDYEEYEPTDNLEDIFQNINNDSKEIDQDLILQDDEKEILEKKDTLSYENNTAKETIYEKYFGEEIDDFTSDKENQQGVLKNEQYDKFTIESATMNIDKELRLSSYNVIPKDSRIQLGAIYKNIDILGFKIIKINEDLDHIIIYPVKICNLKGMLIINDESVDYKPFQKEFKINSKEKELLISSNLYVLQKAHHDIFQNIINEGTLFQLLRKYLKKEIIVEKTRSGSRLFFRSGQLQYKILIEPILICQNDIGFLEKTLVFPYIKKLNLHLTKKLQFGELLEFIETKHLLIDTYVEQSNSVKTYFNSRNKFINDLRLISVPFIIYGFIFLMIIVFQAQFLINTFIILTTGVIVVYVLIDIYLYLRFHREKQIIMEEFNTPEYLRPVNMDETDLLIIKNELSTELLEQFIYECFEKNNDFKITSEIEQMKFQNQLHNMDDVHHSNNSIQDSFEKNKEEKQILSKYMSLLED